MKKQAIPVYSFQQRLLEWYGRNQRKLPWRETSDSYRIWVSEVMLQQTRVETVIPYYRRFLARFPTVFDLARSREETVLKLWEGLGYYSRARNLHRAAKTVVREFGGTVPSDINAFRSLAGVGEYICAAVLSIAFSKPLAVADGNVKRVLARLKTSRKPVNDSKAHRYFQRAAEKLLAKDRPGDYNQAVMELGALVCIPKNPVCAGCPVSMFCRAFQRGEVRRFPRRAASRKIPTRRIAAAVVRRRGRLLITRRPSSGLLGGLWEFPGGGIEKGETPEQACLRELKEETDITARITGHLITVRHAYTHFRIIMDVFRCEYVSGEVRLNGSTASRWVWPSQLDRYAFPAANRKFIPQLQAGEENSIGKT